MRDRLVRSLVVVSMVALLAYIAYLFLQGAVIVPVQNVESYNALAYALVLLVPLFLLVAYGIYPFAIPRQRVILFFVALLLLLLPQVSLQDYPDMWVYLADILKILWVVVLIVWPTGLIVSEKIVKKQAEENIEIIEV